MQPYTDQLQRALIMIEAYAENADRFAAHALTQADAAEGVARRLWLAECEKERAKAAAFRTAHETISKELGSEGA